jgi:hypothetical protein
LTVRTAHFQVNVSVSLPLMPHKHTQVESVFGRLYAHSRSPCFGQHRTTYCSRATQATRCCIGGMRHFAVPGKLSKTDSSGLQSGGHVFPRSFWAFPRLDIKTGFTSVPSSGAGLVSPTQELYHSFQESQPLDMRHVLVGIGRGRDTLVEAEKLGQPARQSGRVTPEPGQSQDCDAVAA